MGVVDSESRVLHGQLWTEHRVHQPFDRLELENFTIFSLDLHRPRAVQAQHLEPGVGGERLDTAPVLHRQVFDKLDGFLFPWHVAPNFLRLALRHVVDQQVHKDHCHCPQGDRSDDPPAPRWLITLHFFAFWPTRQGGRRAWLKR